MADAKDKLRDLLNSHVESQQKAKDAADLKEAEFRRWQSSCAKELRDIVLPTLTRLATEIQKLGHKAVINDRLSGYSYPNVDLAFTPKNVRYPDQSLTASIIGFVCSEQRTIDLKVSIYTLTGEKPHSAFDIIARDNPTPSPITPEWVEQQVVGFVERVLKANKV